jgi:hypothetical protein
MTALTRAIVNHDLEAIVKLVAEDRGLLEKAENGWLPVDWARRTGNFATLTRLYRVMGDDAPEFSARQILRTYFEVLRDDEFEPVSADAAASMLWATLFEGGSFMVGRFKRPFVSSEGQAEDLRFLIHRAGIRSSGELVGVGV